MIYQTASRFYCIALYSRILVPYQHMSFVLSIYEDQMRKRRFQNNFKIVTLMSESIGKRHVSGSTVILLRGDFGE